MAAMDRGAVDILNLPAIPFAFSPYLSAARQLLIAGPFRPALIGAYLDRAIDTRPLYAPAWLDRAELALRRGSGPEATRHARTARGLWPTRPELQWRVAMFHVRAGNDALALAVLRDYLAARPRELDRVLAVATRLEEDAGEIVASMLPVRAETDADAGWLLKGLMSYARRTGNVPLASAAWSAASVPARAQSGLAVPHVEFLLREGELTMALEAWKDFSGLPARRGGIFNGGFERPVAGGGFGWWTHDVDGATAARDENVSHSGCCSMRVRFDGSANTHYHHLRQRVPVEGGRRYVLSGWVRGEDVSTRSGVYVEMRTVDAASPARARSDAAWGSWEWTRFEIPLRVPADAGLLEVRLRRDRTDALDNLLSGTVWLDDLRLTASPGADADGG